MITNSNKLLMKVLNMNKFKTNFKMNSQKNSIITVNYLNNLMRNTPTYMSPRDRKSINSEYKTKIHIK